MKRALLKQRSASFLLCLFFSGCVSLDRSYPDKHYFVLEVNRDGQPSNQTANGILEVSDIRISPRYEGQSFVYRISDASYESDFYNQFLIAPAALVTEEVRKGLTQSRIFEYVINSSSQLQPTHRLDGIVNALYGDFRNISASRAVLEIEFFLSKQLPTGTEIVMNKRYSKAVPLSGRSPDALVKGWDEALDGILTSLIADLKSANSR
ncbi:MAG TPA: ABC-type transport auxiliary lipoprotein family protein [Candidatus Udaeobacter sp.]|nr:ABC-type transport auxiliary lipoprotein family protein [Candidatus Udaeobacter sp.]